MIDCRPFRRFRPDARADAPPTEWPFTVPAIRQLAREGLELAAGLTVLVGENGSGKSTVMEALAVTLGLNPEGGSTGARLATRVSEPGRLDLVVERGPGASRWATSCGRRPCTAVQLPGGPPSPRSGEPRLHELTHGEGFLALLDRRAGAGGLYLLDEPDAALPAAWRWPRGCSTSPAAAPRSCASGRAPG